MSFREKRGDCPELFQCLASTVSGHRRQVQNPVHMPRSGTSWDYHPLAPRLSSCFNLTPFLHSHPSATVSDKVREHLYNTTITLIPVSSIVYIPSSWETDNSRHVSTGSLGRSASPQSHRLVFKVASLVDTTIGHHRGTARMGIGINFIATANEYGERPG